MFSMMMVVSLDSKPAKHVCALTLYRGKSFIPRKERLMLTNQNTYAGLQGSKPQEIIIHGATVRLKFAAEQNTRGCLQTKDRQIKEAAVK